MGPEDLTEMGGLLIEEVLDATSSVLEGKWWVCAPRDTPARSATRRVVVPAYPTSTRQAMAASSRASRVSAVRSVWVRRTAVLTAVTYKPGGLFVNSSDSALG
jgi:hypothetical protein